MVDLFNGIDLPENYAAFGSQIDVLPLSLINYYRLWFGENGPKFADYYFEEKHVNNQIEADSFWYSPPKESFKTFNGKKC